ncbi:MAG: hypothetical protein RLZ10_717 [Bacteroidota bacterium]|jgi:hypothetical protein
MKLYQAAHIIESMYKRDVTFIEFEDGSGVKFNFKLKGEDKKQYINLKNIHYKEIKNYIEQITNKF